MSELSENKVPHKKSRIQNIKNKKKQKRKKAFFFSIPGIIILLIIVVISFLGVDQVLTPVIKGSQPLSILLVGSDMNAYREETKEGTKPEKTDSLMVITFNPDIFRFVVTSIPRDTAIDYACMDMRGKVNEIYPASGNDIDCLEESVEDFLNVPIDYYVKVNMDQIEEIIDSVGGISIKAYAADGYLSQINVESTQTYNWVNGETYEMDADEALTYARARHDSERDYGRGKRQQQVIMQVARKLLEQGLNISTIKDLLSMVDTNMQPLLLKKYYDYAKDYQKILQAIEDKKDLTENALEASVWTNMYDYFEYSGEKEVTKFQDYLLENFSIKEIKAYFFESHQFYNDTYNGYYVTPDDQRAEISNKLRTNLGLKEETPPEQTKDFGVNNFGCEVSSTNSCDGSTSPGGTTYTTSDYYDDSYDDDYDASYDETASTTDNTNDTVDSNITNPDTGSDTTDPDTGDKTDPDTGGDTTDPDTGGDTTDPDTGGDTTDPDTGGDTTDPDTGGDTTDPDTGGDTTNPDTGDGITDPDTV
ncbi:MAG: LCP family protein [Mycoplasmatales bacterium]